MIFRLQLLAVILLLSLFILLLACADVINDDFDRVAMLLTAPDNCTDLCILGIRPGQSTVFDAMDRLQNHHWVSDVIQHAPGNGYGQINWGWSGEQPAVIDASQRGQLTFYYRNENPADTKLPDTIIQTVTLYTRIPMYAFQEWFGESSIGNINDRVAGQLEYTVYYDVPDGIISISAEVLCPVTIASYWSSMARMRVSIGRTNDPYSSPSAMVRLC